MKWSETLKTLEHLYYYLNFRSKGLDKETSHRLADLYTER